MYRLLLLVLVLFSLNVGAQSVSEMDSLMAEYGMSFNWNGNRWDSLDVVRLDEYQFAIRHDSTITGYYFGYVGAEHCGNHVDHISVFSQTVSLNATTQTLPNYKFVVLKDSTKAEGYRVVATTASPIEIIASHNQYFEPGEWVKVEIPCPTRQDADLEGYGDTFNVIYIGGQTVGILDGEETKGIEDDINDSLNYMPIPDVVIPDPDLPIPVLTVPKDMIEGVEDDSVVMIKNITGTIVGNSPLTIKVNLRTGIDSIVINEITPANWELSVLPTKDFNGTTSVIVTLIDTAGHRVSDSIIIDILPVNDPPLITQLDTLIINEQDSDTLNIMEYIKSFLLGPNNESSQRVKGIRVVEYNNSHFKSALVERDSALILETLSLPETITDSLKIVLFDNGGTIRNGNDSIEYMVPYTVQYTKRKPVLTIPESSVIGYEDKIMVLTDIKGTDHDGGKLSLSVTYSNTIIKEIDVIENVHGVWDILLTPQKDQYGLDTVTLILTDDTGMSDTAAIDVAFLSVNDKPKILIRNELTFKAGDDFELDLEDYVTYKFGPSNESNQKLVDIKIVETVGEVFKKEITIEKSVIKGEVPEGTLSSTGAFQFKLFDDGGVEHNGIDSSENFIVYFTVTNDNQTEITIDSIDLTDIVVSEGPYDTLYANDETSTIYVRFGDKDSAVVVRNIQSDTLVTIVAHHPHDQFPGTVEVYIKHNASMPTITLLPEGRSEAQAPFGQGSYWVSKGKTIKGTYIEKNGSVGTIWTHDESLELHLIVTKIDGNGKESVTHSLYPLDGVGSLKKGPQEQCIEETDRYRNRTTLCFMVHYDTDDPKIEFITPGFESVKQSSSSLLVSYQAVFDLYNDDMLDTFKIEEPDVRVFDGTGNHQISVSFMDAYGNSATESTIVKVIIPDPTIDVALEKGIQTVDLETWPQANPDGLFNRVFIYNTTEKRFDDRGGDMIGGDEYGILPEPLHNPLEYDETGFVVSLTVTLPPLTAVNGVLNWSHYVTVFYYVYDPIGQFVAKVGQRFVVDRPEYINGDNKVVIKSQIFPKEGYMHDQTGRQLGTGVYIMNGFVETVSRPNKDMFKNIEAQSSKIPIRLKQGYVKD
ncbi:MAG: hypothetical protein OCC49_16740 [Fibrobacterales bacterium]